MPDHNKGQSIRQWNVCHEAEELEEVVAHAVAIKTLLAPIMLRARQSHRANMPPARLRANDSSAIPHEDDAA